MDIQIIIRHGAVYSALASLMTISYLLIVLAAEFFLQKSFGYHSVAVRAVAAFAVGLLLIPAKNAIQRFFDKKFFHASPEEMAEQIKKYNLQIIETDKYKSAATMASGLAHEIRNPLTAIKTFSECLPEKIHDPEFVRKFSRIVPQEVDRIDRLIKELMHFARPSPPNMAPTDICRLTDETADFMSNLMAKSGVRLQKDYDTKESLVIDIDKNQIRQTILNILLNAVDAMPNGGRMTIGIESLSLPPANYVQITFSDTGCGIPPDRLERIFEPFFSEKAHGTGLGLSVTKSIIENHGGKILVNSKIGEGTTFTLLLPERQEEKNNS